MFHFLVGGPPKTQEEGKKRGEKKKEERGCEKKREWKKLEMSGKKKCKRPKKTGSHLIFWSRIQSMNI